MSNVPQGWYPDPQQPNRFRWWDGLRWTEHINDPQPVPVGPGAYQPMATESFAASTPIVVNTGWAWAIALTPLWYGIVNGTLSLVLPTDGQSRPATLIGYVVLIVASLIFAARDRAALLAGGHTSAARSAWMLLSPIAYLIARRISVKRQTGRGAGPGNLFALLILVPLVLAILAAIAIPIFIATQQ